MSRTSGYGLLGDRPLVIQSGHRLDQDPPPPVKVLMPYLHRAGCELGDATVFRDLQDLPPPIRPSRPLFIQSHAAPGGPAVLRHNDRGFDDVVYQAESWREADQLLDFLRALDSWNQTCFVADTEPRGQWIIIAASRDGPRIVGCYPDANSSLSAACRMSDRAADQEFIVKDESAQPPMSHEYHIAHGRVRRTPW
jgi:hypothetical protein